MQVVECRVVISGLFLNDDGGGCSKNRECYFVMYVLWFIFFGFLVWQMMEVVVDLDGEKKYVLAKL